MMDSNTRLCYNIFKLQAGAVYLRNNKSIILSFNKPTVAQSPTMLKAQPNTAVAAHYLHQDALPHFFHIVCTTFSPTVQVASGNAIEPNLQAILKMSNKLSPKAQCPQVFNDITSGSLISTGQLCDDDCIAIFTTFDVIFLKHNQLIIAGLRD